MKNSKILWLITILIVTGMFCTSYAAENTSSTQTAKATNVSFELCPSVQVTSISYYMKKYKGAPRLHFDIKIKNISSADKRFRLSIFLPDGVAGGGFYPRKGKPPVIKAGEELSRTLPMYFDKIPSEYTIKIDEL